MNYYTLRRLLSLASVLGALTLTAVLHATTPGSDNADDPAYAPGWQSGVNSGTGFKGWNLVSSDSSGASGFFIGDSRNVAGGSGADINTNGKSFGIFAKGAGKTAEAYRSFDAPLAVGQSFSVLLAVNFRNGNKGIDLRSAGDEKTIFNLNIGADDYVINNAATGNGSVGNDYSNNTDFTLTFTQTSDVAGTWNLVRSGGVSKSLTGTYSGVAGSVKFYVAGTQSESENDLMLNELKISIKP